jgi:hypothetical protein
MWGALGPRPSKDIPAPNWSGPMGRGGTIPDVLGNLKKGTRLAFAGLLEKNLGGLGGELPDRMIWEHGISLAREGILSPRGRARPGLFMLASILSWRNVRTGSDELPLPGGGGPYGWETPGIFS